MADEAAAEAKQLSTKRTTLDNARSSPPPPSPYLGGLSLRGFFDAVDSGLAFLEREAAEAEAAAALEEARANVALVGDAAAMEETTTRDAPSQPRQPRRRSRRAPAPGWPWVADHLLTLIQQYSGGLSEPVMRTSLWQAWRQLPPDGEPTPQLRWTALSTLLESAATDPVPRSATRGGDVVRVRLLGIGSGAPSPPSPGLPPVLEVSDASTRGASCEAMVHSSLVASAEASAAAAAAGAANDGVVPKHLSSPLFSVGGTLRMAGVVAWRPTGLASREEEEKAEEEEEARRLAAEAEQRSDDEEDDDDVIGAKKKLPRSHSASAAAKKGFGVRPFLLPTAAVLREAPDLRRAAELLRGGEESGSPSSLVPASLVASGKERGDGVVAAGVVVSVGPLERDFSTAASARASSGVARVVWLSDDLERKKNEGEGGTSPTPVTPLLLLDALAPAGDALSVGEVLLLPGATPVAPPPSTENNNPQQQQQRALEARPGAALVVVPADGDAPAEDGDEGVDDKATAAPRNGSRPPLSSLRPGVARVALCGKLVSSSLVASGSAAARRQQQTQLGTTPAGGSDGKERDLSLVVDDGSGALAELRMRASSAPRSAWAARRGEVIVATAARASVVAVASDDAKDEGNKNRNDRKLSFVVTPASRVAFQSLPRLPALLASPSLSAPGLSPSLRAAIESLSPPSSPLPPLFSLSLSPSSSSGSSRCALVDAVVASPPAVSVRRAHSACGRPLRRSPLMEIDAEAMAEAMMTEGDDFGVGGKVDAAAATATAPAREAAPAAENGANSGSLVLSVPAPTPKAAAGGGGGSTAKKNGRASSAAAATPASGKGGASAAADDAGFLWTCDFCGVDCSSSGVSLCLELDLELAEKGKGGAGAASTPAVVATARAEGAPASTLLGCVPSEFVSWSGRARSARAASLAGRSVRVALVGSGGGEAVDVAGVALLDDDESDVDESDGK